jgi:hypothetical protein
MVKYLVNWERIPLGNAKSEGTILKIEIPNASYISGGIYQNNMPILAIFGHGSKAQILLKRKGKKLKGLAVLKIRGHTLDSKGFGFDDAFIIQ